MLLELSLICHLIILTAANPFHKYPFVFLLDVGNEELQKTNTEQIRVSIPGGSLAIRYPAIGDGDTIAHVRVSGIDFGTDLKANIVDGGPGYKYVVMVFLGNPSAPYDAVVTIKTLSNDKLVDYDSNLVDSMDTNISNEESEESDPNDSAEDTNDDVETGYSKNTNAELVSSSSNIYSYAQSQIASGDYDKDVDNENLSEEKDIHNEYNKKSSIDDDQNIVNDYVEVGDKYQDEGVKSSSKDDVSAERYNGYAFDENNNDNQVAPGGVADSNLYEQYEEINPHLQEAVPTYRQEPAQEPGQNGKPVYEEVDLEDIDQMFNDDEVGNDGVKYRDSNNNNFDSDDVSVVAY